MENYQEMQPAASQSIEQNKGNACSIIMQPKILLAFNVLLLIGLIVLYVLFFNQAKTSVSTTMSDAILSKSGAIKIAFLNSDSLMEQYQLVVDLKDELEASQKDIENKLQWKQESFKKEAIEFYEKAQKGGFTSQQQAESEQQRLAQKEQSILEYNQKVSQDLAKMEVEMHNRISDSVTNFLKRYYKKYGFDFILGYSRGGGILFANDSLDISKNVIIEMNKTYSKKKEK